MKHQIQINKRNGEVSYSVAENGGDYVTISFLEYLKARRRALITELRQIDEALGNPPTIPPRCRPR